MDIALFENAKFGDIFITTEKKQAVFLRLAENAEYKFAFLYIEDWGIVQVFRHNGKEIHNDVAHSVVGKYENPVGEEFEKALAEEWKGYIDRGAATVDALEDNTQELAFAKGFYRGAKWQKNQGVTKEAVIGMATEEISINISQSTLDALDLCAGDKVIIQIRKKEDRI